MSARTCLVVVALILRSGISLRSFMMVETTLPALAGIKVASSIDSARLDIELTSPVGILILFVALPIAPSPSPRFLRPLDAPKRLLIEANASNRLAVVPSLFAPEADSPKRSRLDDNLSIASDASFASALIPISNLSISVIV